MCRLSERATLRQRVESLRSLTLPARWRATLRQRVESATPVADAPGSLAFHRL
jgi:hypothetical protein